MIDAKRSCRTGVSGSDSCVGIWSIFRLRAIRSVFSDAETTAGNIPGGKGTRFDYSTCYLYISEVVSFSGGVHFCGSCHLDVCGKIIYFEPGANLLGALDWCFGIVIFLAPAEAYGLCDLSTSPAVYRENLRSYEINKSDKEICSHSSDVI